MTSMAEGRWLPGSMTPEYRADEQPADLRGLVRSARVEGTGLTAYFGRTRTEPTVTLARHAPDGSLSESLTMTGDEWAELVAQARRLRALAE